ncbi:MAG: hypothetical protein KatS3mg035_0501 [Bacteroidia bacterium]|nr:MAG: hypothetical protein KatS3mg035_0501 [Bacteroidia bacterium]
MKKIFIFTACLLWSFFIIAQPANDNCANAIQVTPLDGTCVQYTTVGSTPDLNISSCPEGVNNVWFFFDAVSTTATITVSGITRPEIALLYFDPIPCDIGSAFEHDCVDGGGFYTSITMNATGLTVGSKRYYIVVTTN